MYLSSPIARGVHSSVGYTTDCHVGDPSSNIPPGDSTSKKNKIKNKMEMSENIPLCYFSEVPSKPSVLTLAG